MHRGSKLALLQRGRFRRVSGACGLLFASGLLLGAADSPPGLSLDEAQRLAVTRNWDQLSSQRDVTIADTQRVIARQWPNPTAGVSTTHINTDDRGNPATTGNKIWDRSYDSVFSVTQLFEIGGKRAARQASALAGYEGARAQLSDVRRMLKLAVVRAYVAAALADTASQIATESAGQLRTAADLAVIRLKAGDIAQSELDRIEIAARQMELQAQAARAAATSQRIFLETLLGNEHPTGSLVLQDRLESLASSESPEAQSPPLGRPDVVVAEQALRRTEAELRLQRAQRIPDPSLLVQYEHQPADSPNSVGVGLSFPLPLWNRNRGAIHIAATAREQATLVVNKVKAQVAADFAMARVSVAEARARWTDYRDNVQPRTERVREAVALAYQRGGASLLDLLEAQRSGGEVRLATAQAAADVAVAHAALAAAMFNFDSDSDHHP
jgi:cobalt-zinc-cadmium efflux system outer membrane protein